MRYTATGVSLLVAGLLATPALAGPKWEVGENAWLSLAFLGQAQATHTEDADQKNDFFLRRGRIILAGQVMDGVKFFVETDNDNAGKRGRDDQNTGTDIQDAFIDVRLGHSNHWVEAGLILLPFSFENKSSAAKLLGHDYNLETIKLTNTFVWRDYGVELHGNFGSQFAYRVGVFDGYENDTAKNPDAGLRYTGHVAFNPIGEVETGWFMTQERFEGTYLSLGAGGDHQTDASGTSEDNGVDSTAFVVDLQSGFQLGDDHHLTVNDAWYNWDSAGFDGNTAFVEAGLLVGKVMPTGKWSMQDPEGSNDINDYTLGVQYFFKRHNARAGLEYRVGDSSNLALLGVQFLL
jgi:hypothetical protein